MRAYVFYLSLIMILSFSLISCSDDDNSSSPEPDMPEITVLEPVEFLYYERGDTIRVKADAKDADGFITSVRFYFDGDPIGDDDSFVYSCDIPTNGYMTGEYVITIEALDNDGNVTSQDINIEIINGIGGMSLVKGGYFEMGDNFDQDNFENDIPVHEVHLESFYMEEHEVKYTSWQEYMGKVQSIDNKQDLIPVKWISWYETLVYCNKRSFDEGYEPCYSLDGETDTSSWGEVPTDAGSGWEDIECDFSADGYRLPTEAEWEYAARGGIYYKDNFRFSGCNYADLEDYAWFDMNNYIDFVNAVTQKLPNQLGLYDMSGNVAEFCWDWYSEEYYSECDSLGSVDDPKGPGTGAEKIARGGAHDSSFKRVTVSVRTNKLYPYSNSNYIATGFRVVRTY